MKMKIPIIAASQTKFGELWGKGIDELIKEAGENALRNTSLKPSDIGKLYIANAFASKTGHSLLSSVAHEELGISESIQVNAGDASGAVAIHEAANSIMSGESSLIMVLGVEKLSDFKTNELFSLSSGLVSMQESAAGATVQSQFAIITKKYADNFKLNAREFSFIPSKNHKNALSNENAQYRFELPESKISSSPIIAEPLRMFDFASYCDGAALLVMCSPKIAKKFKNKVKGCLMASSFDSDCLSLSKRKSIIEFESAIRAGKKALESAKLDHDDIDLMEVHDFAPISEIMAI